ncbi:MAG: ABC transporter ATP-binding protein [Desulfarculaceae bacterium]|nr:ABC transporter ATP-binding protein [Desulfarculaceae bacterium]MCF8048385.1 ABC transporter ATP-binding protein [Desulfarculaceae bacterium]MCF8066851.1 ABC transporter ATP-binding protein [Desulfarculaceae bacterium]MCF8099633.1 ABC transporter ATP-binding protein [Desulfarculaceae bacterium]MCF8124087.1 ABC transporter ATP-binding protein [Desulfarculaceae bacterium]
MLEIKNLSVKYDDVEVLHGVSLEVGDKEVVALIGPNGAGKTTLLRSVSGLVKASCGETFFMGRNLNLVSSDEIVRQGISHVPEGRRVFYNMSVMENLLLGGYVRDKKERKQTLEYVFEMFPRLAERKQQRGGTLSGGEQSMLVVGRALMNRPKLLLMDEPCLGLAPIIVNMFAESINKMARQGLTILLVEQNARFALSTATRGYVLTNGKIVAQGETEELMGKEEEIRKAYLGA